MKKTPLLLPFILFFSFSAQSQCTISGATQTGSNPNATSCVCPAGGGTVCDLIPDISIAIAPLNQPSNYTEYPQTCNPACSGNQGRLRIGVSTPIIGYGPLETRGTSWYVCGTDTLNAGTVANIPATCPTSGLAPKQLINQRIYRKNGNSMNYTERAAGSMTYHASHGHQHVDDWGIYTLRTNNGDPNPLNWPIIGTGSKLGFCLIDLGTCTSGNAYCTDTNGTVLHSGNIANFGLGGGNYGCNNTVQGITNGSMDTYSQGLDGMWINIPPGVCNGTYWVVVQIDPLNYFLETIETNNVVAVPITLTKQAGTAAAITASGPLNFCQGGSVILTATGGALNYLWNNGATTQSIVINASGTFSFSMNTTTSCPTTSSPVTVTVSPMSVTASSTPTTICQGQSVQLSTSTNASATANVIATSANNAQVFVPDNVAAGVTSPITISGISPVALGPNTVFSVTLNLTHTYDGDLIVSLISPSGNQINLSNRRGGGGDNFTNTVFTMNAVTAIGSGAAPFTGSFVPDGAFSSLTGNVNGIWQLKVADVAAVDTGRIQNWSLKLYNTVTNVVTYNWISSPAGFNSSAQNPNASPNSTTTYTVSTSDLNGCAGFNSVAVTVNANPSITVSPSTAICNGSSTVLTASGASTYSWAPPTGLNTTTGSMVIASPTVTTAYTVTGTLAGCSGTSTVTITIDASAVPSQPGVITGDNIACANSFGFPYSIPSVAGANSYTWIMPANAVVSSGAGTTNVTVDFLTGFVPSSVCVRANNTCGSSVQRCKSITSVTPQRVSTITGPIRGVCNAAASYTAAHVNGASAYIWTPPSGATIIGGQGTATVQLQFANNFNQGNLCVVASNSCGTSSNTRCLTIKGLPANPTSVSGPATVCANQQNVVYSTPLIAGATSYNWTKPGTATIVSGQGTNNITVNFGANAGTLKVRAQNACGNSNYYSYSVSTTCRIAGAAANDFMIHPNPANSFAEIDLYNFNEGIYQLKLIDITGSEIYSRTLTTSTEKNNFILDLKNYSKGIYFVSLVNNEMRVTKKLVIE